MREQTSGQFIDYASFRRLQSGRGAMRPEDRRRSTYKVPVWPLSPRPGIEPIPWNIGGLPTLYSEILFRCIRAPNLATGAAMQTSKLVVLELPNSRFVVRVRNGPRLGRIFTQNGGGYDP